jgi:hypothetical protein
MDAPNSVLGVRNGIFVPDIVGVGFTGVQSHTHFKRSKLIPESRLQAALGIDSCPEGGQGGGEDNLEGITKGFEHNPAMDCDRLAQDGIVHIHRGFHKARMLLEPWCIAFDVGE